MTAPYMRIASTFGTVDLNGIATSGEGVEAQPGVTGLGLPPIEVIYGTNAGDGSTYLGRRISSRTIEIPVGIYDDTRAGLRDQIRTLTKVVTAESVTLSWVDPVYGTYTILARLEEGGDYEYGDAENGTIGEKVARTSYKFRSDEPFWTKEATTTNTFSATTSPITCNVNNDGTAPVLPKLTVTGPTNGFTIKWGSVEFTYNQNVIEQQSVIIDTSKWTVVDNNGVNRYGALAPSPAFGSLPAGATGIILTTTAIPSGEVDRNHIINPALAGGSGTSWTKVGNVATAQNSTSWGWQFAQEVVSSSTPTTEVQTTMTGLAVGKSYVFHMEHTAAHDGGYVQFEDANGRVISQVPIPPVSARSVFTTSIVAPTTQMNVSIHPPRTRLTYIAPYSTQVWAMWCGRLCFSQGGGFFSGSTAASSMYSYSWAGTANNSQSIKTYTQSALKPTLKVEFKPKEWQVI